jgi:ABC-type dipeptide/oligopeptide/nickel transport system permease component
VIKLILRRLLAAIPSLIGVIIVTFIISHTLPGDPAAYFAGPSATPESIAATRADLGLDRPLPIQFANYTADLLQGNLGQSFTSGQPVLDDLLRRLPASLELTLYALLFAIIVALPLGLLAAANPGSWIDHVCRGTVTAAAAFPSFFVGLLLIFIFYYSLGIAPSPVGRLEIFLSIPPKITGFYTIDALITGDFEVARAAFGQLILPAISLGLFALAPLARMTRASMLGVLGSEFITTARAEGLSEWTILVTYGFRNALLPLVNVLGMIFSFLLGANVLIEQVFGWPGVGSYAVEAVLVSDYAAIQGFVVMMAFLYILLNLTVDVLNTVVDPRVRYDS